MGESLREQALHRLRPFDERLDLGQLGPGHRPPAVGGGSGIVEAVENLGHPGQGEAGALGDVDDGETSKARLA